jgi:hypothetical protein
MAPFKAESVSGVKDFLWHILRQYDFAPQYLFRVPLHEMGRAGVRCPVSIGFCHKSMGDGRRRARPPAMLWIFSSQLRRPNRYL